MLTPRNSGAAPWTRVQDVTFTNNVVRHVAGVVNIAGFDDSDPTLRTERITFRNNLFDDVNHSAYGTNAKALLVGGGAAALVFDRNTIIHTNSSVLYAYGASMPGVVYTNNVSQHHRYGIMGKRRQHRKADDRRVLSRRSVPVQRAGRRHRLALSDAECVSDRRGVGHCVREPGGWRLSHRLRQRARPAGCGGSVPGADFRH